MSRRAALPALGPAPASASVVDVLTGTAPIVAPLPDGPATRTAAEVLTSQIRHTAREVGAGLARLRQLVEQAREHDVWAVLGYASWPAYLVDVLEPMRLPREDRREVVGYLTGQGLSTRAIAPIVSADQKTVVNDRRALALVGPVAGEETSSPAVIAGLDGKTYETTPPRPRLVVVTASGESAASEASVRVVMLLTNPEREGFVMALADVLDRAGVITRAAWDAALAATTAVDALHQS